MRVAYGSFGYNGHEILAKKLKEKYGWQPTYWFADPSVETKIQNLFPEVVFQDINLTQRGIHSNFLKDTSSYYADKATMDALSSDLITSIQIASRSDATGHNFTVQEHVEHQLHLINFWQQVIKTLKIELFISWNNPHGSDFILCSICKLLEIPILYIDSAWCINENSHFISNSIHDKMHYIRKQMATSTFIPNPKTLTRIQVIKGNYAQAIPSHMFYSVWFGTKGQYLKKSFNFLKEFAIALLLSRKKININFKFHSGWYRDSKTKGSYLDYFLYSKRIQNNGAKYKKSYMKYITQIDNSKPYIYFAANYQPEQTTLPDAGIYCNLYLILELLSEQIPDDWQIIFKEHPAQFKAIVGGDLWRNDDYYKKISQIPKVKLVHPDTNPFDLSDKAKAVATATSTAAWEAVVRGTPALVFGQPWYVACSEVFLIESKENLRAAVDKIINGFKPSFENILNFAGALDKFCVHDFEYFYYPTECKVFDEATIDFQMTKIADYFYQSYLRYNKNGDINDK